MKFTELIPRLSNETLRSVHDGFGFIQATPVQAATISLFMSNKDVSVEATTGSGKTLAFAIPIIEILNKLRNDDNNKSKYNIGSLIIAPTRELAQQIYEVVSKILIYHNGLKCSLFVGGTSIQECMKTFNENGANIVVGTPGRILDMMNRCSAFNMRRIEVLVLDEADMLLDMGFRDTINQILANMPKQRRTGLFSATQTKEVKELARAGLRNPVTVTVKVQLNKSNTNSNIDKNKVDDIINSTINDAQQQATPSTLANFFQVCPYDTRLSSLASFLLSNSSKKIIIFCSTCACVDYYSKVFDLMTKTNKLTELMKQQEIFQEVINKAMEWHNYDKNTLTTNFFPAGFQMLGMHGKMVPKKRNGVYQKFLSLSSGVLFTTDVAARGVDIPDVDWIVQLAAPKDPAFFVHRVGRTARAGKVGGALLFVTEEERAYVEFLKGRGVPMKERINIKDIDLQGSILSSLILLACWDRALLEAGSTAFMSFLRAYKEHSCSYIFRFSEIDIGSIARSYGLLRLPKIPETRGVKGREIVFDTIKIDTSLIPYRHLEREEARKRKIQEKNKLQNDDNNDNNNDTNGIKVKPKVQWVPKEEYKPKEEIRKRKKKKSEIQKFTEEWEEFKNEETAWKKFKKRKISKEEYDEKYLLNEDEPSTTIDEPTTLTLRIKKNK